MCRLASWLVCMLLAITAAGTVAHAAPAVRVASDDSADGTAVAADESPTEGTLYARTNDEAIAGVFPLTHTDVHATVSGFISRVTVTQQFQNTFARKIEAVVGWRPAAEGGALEGTPEDVGYIVDE